MRNGDTGGEYPDAGIDCGGNIPEAVATIIFGLTGTVGNGNVGPVTTGSACLGLGGTLAMGDEVMGLCPTDTSAVPWA